MLPFWLARMQLDCELHGPRLTCWEDREPRQESPGSRGFMAQIAKPARLLHFCLVQQTLVTSGKPASSINIPTQSQTAHWSISTHGDVWAHKEVLQIHQSPLWLCANHLGNTLLNFWLVWSLSETKARNWLPFSPGGDRPMCPQNSATHCTKIHLGQKTVCDYGIMMDYFRAFLWNVECSVIK